MLCDPGMPMAVRSPAGSLRQVYLTHALLMKVSRDGAIGDGSDSHHEKLREFLGILMK